MRLYKKELDIIANDLLTQQASADINKRTKPNYSDKDFLNIIIIFQMVLMDKIYDVQDYDDMSVEERVKMIEKCSVDFHRFIYTYTGVDTDKL